MGTSNSAGSAQPARGVISRAAEALFTKLNQPPVDKATAGTQSTSRYSSLLPSSRLSSSSAKALNWQLKASYVEIYNEQLRDLLIPDSVAPADRARIHIREDTKGNILLSGLTQRDVTTPDDILAALESGSSIRQTDATAINSKSSRSHAIFTLTLTSQLKCPPTNTKEKRMSMPLPRSGHTSSSDTVNLSSKIHFVDLAGSERLKNSGALGERAKEGISINAGLASLAKVITQLSSRHPGHVSYRDSRLTRILQDSLGGSAVTYMLACVTPAEFHLTETLNTLHYAQRARAIQSKPEIQRIETGDQDARVARLQSEIAFLREQIKKDSSEQRPLDRDRAVRRVGELREQLFDMQQKYNALSSRHALLIQELGQIRSEHADTPVLDQTVGTNAVDRLQRSTAFAEAVEQVVSEYEKTIRNLESVLTNTRATLSEAEDGLTERDVKITTMQSANHMLQGRLQIFTDRNADNEAYLARLESEVETANSGESRSTALIDGLRSELMRAKESQTNSEGYISALEQRLSDAEQDQAIMQRELDRLEQVVERQRSVNRLDGLMSKLDTFQEKKRPSRSARRTSDPDPASDVMSPRSTATSEQDINSTSVTTYSRSSSPESALKLLSKVDPHDIVADEEVSQSVFLTDKVESLSQELFDLRGEHESAINEHEELQRKYALALQELATTAAATTETINKDRPVNHFLDGRSAGEASPSSPSSHQASPSRSLSSRSSSGQQQFSKPSAQQDTQNQCTDLVPASPSVLTSRNDAPHSDEKDLAQAHQHALAQIESLKKELFRARLNVAPSPTTRKSPLLRRKPSQDVPIVLANTTTDRTNRSFASLRNMALDHFENNAEMRQNFDVQLDQIMSDLHDRSGKLQESQVELASLRKDLESKTAMVAGLTRERSSVLGSTSVDFTVLSKLQDQLQMNEVNYQKLKDSSNSTELRLQARIHHLQTQLANELDNDNDTTLVVQRAASDAVKTETTNGRILATPETDEVTAGNMDDDSATGHKRPSEESLVAKVSELERALALMTDKEKKSDRLVQELEEQLSSTYDQQEASTKRASAVQTERQMQLEEALKARLELEKDMEDMRQRLMTLESGGQEAGQHHRQISSTSAAHGADGLGIEPLSPPRRMGRSVSASSLVQRPSSPAASIAGSTMALPSPPPAMPLPPIPLSPSVASPIMSPMSDRNRGASPNLWPSPRPDSAHAEAKLAQAIDERERRIRTIEKHLFAEKQLTATLEEALVDLETAQSETRGELDQWRKRCSTLEDEMIGLRKEKTNSRSSLQAVEEEREMRLKAERARNALEERMREFNATMNKKKKNKLNCFA